MTNAKLTLSLASGAMLLVFGHQSAYANCESNKSLEFISGPTITFISGKITHKTVMVNMRKNVPTEGVDTCGLTVKPRTAEIQVLTKDTLPTGTFVSVTGDPVGVTSIGDGIFPPNQIATIDRVMLRPTASLTPGTYYVDFFNHHDVGESGEGHALLGSVAVVVADPIWAVRYGDQTPGGSNYDQSTDVQFTAEVGDKLILGGQFNGTASFGSYTFTDAGGGDGFVLKLDASGNIEWAKQLASDAGVTLEGLAANANGVYIAGSFSGTLTVNGTSLTSAGDYDGFVLRLDLANGQPLQSRRIGGTGLDVAAGLETEGSTVLVAGYFQNTVNFGAGNVASEGLSDCYLGYYNSTLGYVSVRQIGGTGNCYAVDVSSQTEPAIVGWFDGAVRFNGGFTNGNFTSMGSSDGFMARYTMTGGYVWSRAVGGTGEDRLWTVFVDGSRNVHFGGFFTQNYRLKRWDGVYEEPFSSSRGGRDAVFTTMTDGAAHTGSVRVGGNGNDEIKDLVVSGNDLWITGQYSGTEVNPIPPGTFSSINFGLVGLAFEGGVSDIFLAAYSVLPSAYGKMLWAESFGTNADATGNGETGWSLALKYPKVAFGGRFTGTIDFGDQTLQSNGDRDAFISVIDP